MALPEINATCTACGSRFVVQPTRTFLGFQTFKCRKCRKEVIFPLTSGYRAMYQAAIVFLILGSLVNLSKGRIPLPGVLGIAGIIALVKDRKIKKEVEEAELRALANEKLPDPPRTPPLVPPQMKVAAPLQNNQTAKQIVPSQMVGNNRPLQSSAQESVITPAPIAQQTAVAAQAPISGAGSAQQPMQKESQQKTQPLPQAAGSQPAQICPACKKKMVIRCANSGPHSGKSFWVCSGYPECKTFHPVKEGPKPPIS